MREGQREAVREGWMENLDRTIFTIPMTDDAEIAMETEAVTDTDAVNQQMEEEFEKEKEELEEKCKFREGHVESENPETLTSCWVSMEN